MTNTHSDLVTRRVLKYPIGIEAQWEIPIGKIVLFAPQGDTLCVWVEVEGDPWEAPKRRVIVLPTGRPVCGEHILSTQEGPNLVWHLYDISEGI